MSPTTGRPSLRDRTREEVFALIRGSRDLTRSTLVELTGLPSSTVGHAVARLILEGRVTESTPPAKGPGSGSGRPGSILNAVATSTRTGAIDFGHRHFRVALGDDQGNVVDEEIVQLNVDRSPVNGLDAAAASLRALGERNGVSSLACVAAGVPGPIEAETGLVCSTTTLSNWAGMYPARELEKRLGVPALVSNDASAGALGELHHGAGRGHRDFLYIKASHGIGAGMVVGGELFEGGNGFAGEIGHIIISGRPELCRCGNRGCLEAVVSVPSVKEQLSHTHPHLDVDAVDLATLNDPVSARILNESGRTMGTVLAGLCDLLNPTILIIGGELGASGQPLIDGVRASVNRFAQPSTSSAIEIVAAGLGQRAELVGTVQLAATLARA
ncbi:MAG: ROK family protein [Propionibacteriaceae bacterium]|nr:ROK family protein [Propionibacteriaceae bacterium]